MPNLKTVQLRGTNCTAEGIAKFLGNPEISNVVFVSSDPIKRGSKEIKALQAWCDQQPGRSALIGDGVYSEILKSTLTYVEQLKNTPVVF